MPQMTLEELIERCLSENWICVNPCEVFRELRFPDDEPECDDNCAKCLLKASGWDEI